MIFSVVFGTTGRCYYNPYVEPHYQDDTFDSISGDASPNETISSDVQLWQTLLTSTVLWGPEELHTFDCLHEHVCCSHATFRANRDFLDRLLKHLTSVAANDASDTRITNFLCILHKGDAAPIDKGISAALAWIPRGIQRNDKGCAPLCMLTKAYENDINLLELVCAYITNVPRDAYNLHDITMLFDCLLQTIRGLHVTNSSIVDVVPLVITSMDVVWRTVIYAKDVGWFKYYVLLGLDHLTRMGLFLFNNVDALVDMINMLVVQNQFIGSDPCTVGILMKLFDIVTIWSTRGDLTEHRSQLALQEFGKGHLVRNLAMASKLLCHSELTHIVECIEKIKYHATLEGATNPCLTLTRIFLLKLSLVKRAGTHMEKLEAVRAMVDTDMPKNMDHAEVAFVYQKTKFNLVVHSDQCLICLATFTTTCDLAVNSMCTCVISVHYTCAVAWLQKMPTCLYCRGCVLPGYVSI